jgi:tetratricopeptide (TPR) repeat protein
VGAWTYLLNQAPILLRYLRTAIWPTQLVLDYGLPRHLTLRDVLPAAAPILLLLGLTAAAWRRHRELAFLGTWFFVTLAPTSTIVPIATEVGGERRMYLPIAALVVLAVVVVRRFVSRHDVRAVALIASCAALGVLTFQRNAEYHDGLGLWQTVLDRYPQGRAHYNLGIQLRAANRRAEAMREFEIAAPELDDAEYALGFELSGDGRHDEATAHLQRYVLLKPDDVNVIRAYNLLGRELSLAGKLRESEDAFRQVLRMQPQNVDGLGGLGESLLRQERLDESIAVYQEYVRVAPPNPAAYFNLGLALGRLRRDEEALAAFRRAVALDPRDPVFRANLASGLVATGRVADAIDEYRRAAELEPDPTMRNEINRIVAQLAAPQRSVR